MDETENTAVAQAAPVPDKVTLEEFCQHLSKSDKRVELIGAFYHVEKAAGRVKDFESNFESRFVAFTTQPV